MSVWFYRLVYGLGKAPWERLASLPASRQLYSLFDRVETRKTRPYGAALELGCGTGHWSIRLVSRGWNVTGIEIVPWALRTARSRARDANVDVRFIKGDVTALREAGVGTGFQLVLDLGTVHGLTPEQRVAVGSEVTAVTVPGAMLIMYAFKPSRRGPLPRGMSREEIQETYPEWTIEEAIPFDLTGAPESLGDDDPHWYRLVRR